MRVHQGTCTVLYLLIQGSDLVRGFRIVSTPYKIGARFGHKHLDIVGTPRSVRHDVATAPSVCRRATTMGETSTAHLETAPHSPTERTDIDTLQTAPPSTGENSLEHTQGHCGTDASNATSSSAACSEGEENKLPPAPPFPSLEGEQGGEVEEKREDGTVGSILDVDAMIDNVMEGVGDVLKGAGMAVTPVSRGADGRLVIDGQGLLNLVRTLTVGGWTEQASLRAQSRLGQSGDHA